MNCPCCNKSLSTGFEMKENAYIAWCAFGPCESNKANDGATGKTELEAQQNLIKLLEKNPDWKNE